MDYNKDPLWQRIMDYDPDKPNAETPFSKRLMALQGWSASYTKSAIDEYKKFIYLCCVSPHGASPPEVVDEVWHLHLTYTTDYWLNFCRDTLHRDIHHHPSAGGVEEKLRHIVWYEQTLEIYRQIFGEEPPPNIWPPPQTEAKTSNTPDQNIPDFFEAGNKYRFLLLLLPFYLIGILFFRVSPFQLTGTQFLFFYPLLVLFSIIANYMSLVAKRTLLYDWLAPRLPVTDKYELAYLAGGEARLKLLYIAELVHAGALKHIGADEYLILPGNISSTPNYLNRRLAIHESQQVNYDQLDKWAAKEADDVIGKYTGILAAYTRVNNNLMIPVLTFGIGILRVMQGMGNEKPIDYLVLMMIIYAFIHSGIRTYYSFGNSCKKLIEDDAALVGGLGDAFGAKLITNGADYLAGMAVFDHLRLKYEAAMTNNNGSSCGGSSCGGGGCGGGGCGGCGG